MNGYHKLGEFKINLKKKYQKTNKFVPLLIKKLKQKKPAH